MADWSWCVSVFCRNEAPSIRQCVDSILAQCQGRPHHVYVVINGCSDNTVDVVRQAGYPDSDTVSVLEIPFGDKRNAWNQLIHRVKPAADLYLFADGYITLRPNALRLLESALIAAPEANAAAAVPSSGRAAAIERAGLLEKGGLHGSLHALAGQFVSRIRTAGFKLPVGLYRGDGLIASMALHDLSPTDTPWDRKRIVVAPEASWTFRPLAPWRWQDAKRYLQRRVQQARGRLENAAIRRIIRAGGYGGLPVYADDMIRDYLAADSKAAAELQRWDPFARTALRRLQSPRRPGDDELAPRPVN
jgi:glycosyltransferase involved in cell wall biosynthesis